MPVLSRLLRERHGFNHQFVANDNDWGGVFCSARDVAPGERWAFVDHRSMREVIAAERLP